MSSDDDVARRLAVVKDQIGYEAPASSWWSRARAALLVRVTGFLGRPRGGERVIRAHGEAWAAVMGTMIPGCLCGHRPSCHSESLAGRPCLECDCPALMMEPRRR